MEVEDEVEEMSPTTVVEIQEEESDTTSTLKRQCWQKCHIATLFVLFVLSLIVAAVYCHKIVGLLQWIQELPVWQSGLILFILYLFVALPIGWGYFILNITAGYIYGFLYGFVMVVFVVLYSSFVIHVLLQRYFGANLALRLNSEYLRALMRVVEGKHGFKVIVLTRLTPIPFGLQNAVFAMCNIKACQYMSASTVGLLPTQALNSYIGSTLRSIESVMDQNTSDGYIIISLQVLVSILLTVFVLKKAKGELKKTLEDDKADRMRTDNVDYVDDDIDASDPDDFNNVALTNKKPECNGHLLSSDHTIFHIERAPKYWTNKILSPLFWVRSIILKKSTPI